MVLFSSVFISLWRERERERELSGGVKKVMRFLVWVFGAFQSSCGWGLVCFFFFFLTLKYKLHLLSLIKIYFSILFLFLFI